MLTISVKNFGPIAVGSVDLKPLTIFVGPSNTGKSYMATAVYVLFKAFQGDDLAPPRRRDPNASWWERMGYSTRTPWSFAMSFPDDDSSAEVEIFEWVRKLEEEGLDPDFIVLSDMPEKVIAEFNRATLEAIGWLRRDVREQLNQAYREPISRIGANESLELTFSRDEPLLDIDFKLDDSQPPPSGFDISQTPMEPSPLALSAVNLKRNEDAGIEGTDLFFEVYRSWLESIENDLTKGVPTSCFYLPAARSGIVLGHKILATELVRQSRRRDDRRAYFPTLPGVTTEFLGNLISLDSSMRRQQLNVALENAITFIERNVLHGEIDLDETAGLPFPEIRYLPVGSGLPAGKFTLDQSSSMVSELAPVILFLKYLVRPGDLLILEEPESHLHPAAQRQLARGIVRLVNAGVRVLITTHSDIIVSQINNLLALRQASPELIESGGFEPEDFLQPEQVGAYLFRYSQELGGCETLPLDIDVDTGIDEDEFAAVFESIYDESIALQRDRN